MVFLPFLSEIGNNVKLSIPPEALHCRQLATAMEGTGRGDGATSVENLGGSIALEK